MPDQASLGLHMGCGESLRASRERLRLPPSRPTHSEVPKPTPAAKNEGRRGQ